MKLSAYLAAEKITPEEFASRIGRSSSGVKKWIYGQRTPRSADLARIAEVTGGRVMPNDFMGGSALSVLAQPEPV